MSSSSVVMTSHEKVLCSELPSDLDLNPHLIRPNQQSPMSTAKTPTRTRTYLQPASTHPPPITDPTTTIQKHHTKLIAPNKQTINNGPHQTNRPQIHRRPCSSQAACHQSSTQVSTTHWGRQEAPSLPSRHCRSSRNPSLPEKHRSPHPQASVPASRS